MGFKKPLEIKVQLTEKCNYTCSFCFNRQGNNSSCGDMQKETAKKIISKIASEGIEKVRFTGGEPLLHPNLFELLSFAKSKGLETMLNTNASLLTKAKCKELAKNTDSVLVSVHSLSLNSKVVENVKELAKKNLFPKAATILTKENISSLEKFHAIIQKLPFSQWVLLRQIPNSLNKNPVSRQDMEKAVEKITVFNSERKKDERFLIENALPFCCWKPEKVSKVSLGGIHEDGHSSLFVNCFGEIKPSYFLDVDLGNALENSFMDSWQSDFMVRMNSLEFIAEPCHKCKHVMKCMSGSRFSALFSNKSLYALDPLAAPNEYSEQLFPCDAATQR